MFGKQKQPPIRSLVGEGTVIQGELRFTEGLRIDGEVLGDVIALGDGHSILVISEKARVVGKVKGGHVIINGVVHGPVHSTELLELRSHILSAFARFMITPAFGVDLALSGEWRTSRNGPSVFGPAGEAGIFTRW